jgi:hypothetical protein
MPPRTRTVCAAGVSYFARGRYIPIIYKKIRWFFTKHLYGNAPIEDASMNGVAVSTRHCHDDRHEQNKNGCYKYVAHKDLRSSPKMLRPTFLWAFLPGNKILRLFSDPLIAVLPVPPCVYRACLGLSEPVFQGQQAYRETLERANRIHLVRTDRGFL